MFVIALLVLGVSGFVLGIFHGDDSKPASVAAAANSAAQKTTPSPHPAAPTITADEMGNKINAIIAANSDTDIGVSITDLKTGQVYHYGLSAVFEAASIGKLITTADYLNDVEHGKASLNDQIDGVSANEQIRLMIEESDNTAWLSMNTQIGHPALAAYAKSIGLSTYDPDKNYIAVDDINTIVTKLYQGKLLNQKDTKLVLDHMKIANEASYIPPAVPSGVTVYHKAGLLDDRVHDAAIINDGKHAYTLVIFTNGHLKFHPTDRGELFHQITKATVAHFINSSL